MSAACLCLGSRRDFENQLNPSLTSLPEATEAQRDGRMCSGSHREAVLGVTVTFAAWLPPELLGPRGAQRCSAFPSLIR